MTLDQICISLTHFCIRSHVLGFLWNHNPCLKGKMHGCYIYGCNPLHLIPIYHLRTAATIRTFDPVPKLCVVSRTRTALAMNRTDTILLSWLLATKVYLLYA